MLKLLPPKLPVPSPPAERARALVVRDTVLRPPPTSLLPASGQFGSKLDSGEGSVVGSSAAGLDLDSAEAVEGAGDGPACGEGDADDILFDVAPAPLASNRRRLFKRAKK